MSDVDRIGRDAMLARYAQWSFPPTDWERRVAAKLARLPRVDAVRLDPADLLQRGYNPHRCHENAARWADTSPGVAVAKGWWLQDEIYVLHSVVRTAKGGHHICVTPPEPGLELPDTLIFVPDALIEFRPGRDPGWYRAGRRIGPGIRMNPEKFIEEIDAERHRLLGGAPPGQL
jgi:hypothetical protein